MHIDKFMYTKYIYKRKRKKVVLMHLVGSFTLQAKTVVRESEWGLSSPIREELWKELCRYHSNEKDFGDFYYWDTVKQMYGTSGKISFVCIVT